MNIPQFRKTSQWLIKYLLLGIAHLSLVHPSDKLEILLIAETVAEDIAEALQGPLKSVSDRLLPSLLNTQRL